jgi:hypothetical protein
MLRLSRARPPDRLGDWFSVKARTITIWSCSTVRSTHGSKREPPIGGDRTGALKECSCPSTKQGPNPLMHKHDSVRIGDTSGVTINRPRFFDLRWSKGTACSHRSWQTPSLEVKGRVKPSEPMSAFTTHHSRDYRDSYGRSMCVHRGSAESTHAARSKSSQPTEDRRADLRLIFSQREVTSWPGRWSSTSIKPHSQSEHQRTFSFINSNLLRRLLPPYTSIYRIRNNKSNTLPNKPPCIFRSPSSPSALQSEASTHFPSPRRQSDRLRTQVATT